MITGIIIWSRKGDRVVEGNGLENRRAGNGTEGSNPSPSAKHFKSTVGYYAEEYPSG